MPLQFWQRAVAAGGQGYYGAAHTELAHLRRFADGPVLSLAHSTQGSLLRQLGDHRAARGWDGRALALAGADIEARLDALVGLAADALGIGRFALSAALLQRAGTALGDHLDAPPRLAIRVAWVRAELAMATGSGTEALEHARRAVGLAAGQPSVRHRVKSAVVLSAALCSAGDVAGAQQLAQDTLDVTAQTGLVPLRWALASLLVGIGSTAHPVAEVMRIRDDAAALITRRGGHWRDA